MSKIAIIIDEYVDNNTGGVSTWTTHFMKNVPRYNINILL